MENRLQIPSEFRSLFTENQANELAAQFQLSDVDQSGFIDANEFRDLLTRLSLHLTDEEANELIENIDKDGNGLIDFLELVQMVVQIKKGDFKFRALRKLLDVLDTTPISLLEREAKKFQMTVTYELLEERKATASFPATFLIELTISGKWCGPKGFEKLQAIGKTTREAKFKAAESGIVRIKKLKPGLAYDIGVLPPEWQNWLYDNLEKGGKPKKLLKILVEKGFSPSKNPILMQRISCKASSLRLRKKHPIQCIFDAKIVGALHPIWTHWCDEELKRGIEGKIVVEELITLGFDKAKSPFLTQQLLRFSNRASKKDKCYSPRNLPCGGNNEEDFTSDAPVSYVYDFWKCVHENNLHEVELFVSAGYDVNEEKLDRHTKVALTPLLLACKLGYTKLVQFFLDQGAEVDKMNSFHRTPLMVAAQYGHPDIAEILLSKRASIFAQDHLDNTPLHMAAIGGSSKVAEMILNTHDNRLRMFVASIPKRKGRSYRALLKEAFTEIMSIKLRSNEKRRFHKNWLFDATKWIYKSVFQQEDRVVPEPKVFLMDHFVERYHGKLIIPDPEDDEANQLSEPSDYICDEEVEFYIDKCIREMYQNLRNKQGRTPLHIACDENLVCTHERLIQTLVENYGCTPLLKDHSGKFPLEHLLACRGRPGSPKGSIEYELKLFSEREARKKAKEEKIKKGKIDERQKIWQQELAAVAVNFEDFEVLAHAKQHAIVVQETEGWKELIEPETKNRFFMDIRSGRLQRSVPEKVFEYRKRRLVWKERLSRARLVERNGDWELYRLNQSDRYFFLHSKTKECVWRRPQEVTGWRTRKVEDDYLDEEELKTMQAQDHINDLIIPDNFDPNRVFKGAIETAAMITTNNSPLTTSRILGEWEESFDTFLSGIVYFHLKTGEFQIEKPLEVELEERARYAMVHIRSRSEDIEDHGAWTRYYDPVTKHTFYYNAEMGEGKHDTCTLDFLKKNSKEKSNAKNLTAMELKIIKEKQELRDILERTRRRENRGDEQGKEQSELQEKQKKRQQYLDDLEASTEATVKREHSDRDGGYIAARFEREWEVRLLAEEHELITSAYITERNMKALQAAKEIEETFEQEESESAFIEDNDSLRAARERRRVSRILYRAIARQKMDMALCIWGCQSWIPRQQYITQHEREECKRRLMVCRLGCDMIKEDWQWQESLSNESSCVIFNHEQTECSSRIAKCSRDCGVWISLCKMDNHMKNLCLRRPIGDLPCRLGCGKIFQGGAHQVLALEQERSCHECEECDLRKVDCTWPKCGNRILAQHRNEHRKSHIISSGIVSFLTAETHSFIVPRDVKKIKVQAWGAGGGSGYLKGQAFGNGGGGAFIEGVVKVFPGETIHIIIGSGGHKGCHAKIVQVNEREGPRMEVHIGVARGGKPGGGVGHGGNRECAAGGGGGYTCIYRESAFGMEYILIAGGGGGGGTCRDGGGGESLKATKPVEGFDFRNGRSGGDQQGGDAGKCDESNPECRFVGTNGSSMKGGNGAEFGGGGGGGYYGGGGGGFSPGIVGGGGGGSSYINPSCFEGKISLEKGTTVNPGGMSRLPPRSVGEAYWDLQETFVGEGGKGSVNEVHRGSHGGVRIAKPGFFEDMSHHR